MNILDLLFPKRCIGCWRFGKYFCDRCTSTINRIEKNESICPVCEKPAIDGATHPRCKTRYSIDGLTSFFRYDGIIRKAVKTLKYRLVTDLAKEFVSLVPFDTFDFLRHSGLRAGIHPQGPWISGQARNDTKSDKNIAFIPIPLHSSRFRDRGFNQAEILGKLLAERLRIPLRTDILKRVKATTPQVEMRDRHARLKNMTGVFHVDKIVLEHYFVKTSCSTIWLFDDVFTTGATMRAAGETLKRAGAEFVWAVTMAR